MGGASLGGVIASRLAFRLPDMFGSVGVFGSVGIRGDEETISAWIAAIPPDQRPRVLIDYGDEDLLALEAGIMMDILDAWHIPYTLNVEPGGHSYAYWSSNIEMYLRWYAEDW